MPFWASIIVGFSLGFFCGGFWVVYRHKLWGV